VEGNGEPLLKNARFLRLWAGQGISFVGDFVSMVAMVILVVELSGSAAAVGGLLVARLLPTLASPLAEDPAQRRRRTRHRGFHSGGAPSSSAARSSMPPRSAP
jgi:hypothetical protein